MEATSPDASDDVGPQGAEGDVPGLDRRPAGRRIIELLALVPVLYLLDLRQARGKLQVVEGDMVYEILWIVVEEPILSHHLPDLVQPVLVEPLP